jgi:biopolymer transport protein ExbD/biopolymer transport protein TolR
MIKRSKTAAIVSDINVTPMVDVMLVLLIIFMVITPLLSKGQTVELTKAKNAIAMKEADAEDAILVAVTRNGETFLMPGNDKVVPEDLPAKVSDLLTGRLDKTVYIKADARAKYQVVTDVVDYLRGAGVDELGLLTEGQAGKQEDSSAPKQ